MSQHVHHHQGIAAFVLGLLGPLAVHRGVHLLVRHHASHPSGQGPLQLLIRNPSQGAGDSGSVGWMVSEKTQRLLQCRPVHPGEEGDVGHGGLAADQAQQGQPQNGLKGMAHSPGPPGVRRLLQTLEQRIRRLHIYILPISHFPIFVNLLPRLCNRPAEIAARIAELAQPMIDFFGDSTGGRK